MTHGEEFADPLVVPGPNLRSLFTDTEEVHDGVAEEVDDDSRFCPSCRRVYPATRRSCADDGTPLVELPPPVET